MKTQVLTALALLTASLAPGGADAAPKKESLRQFMERYFVAIDSKDVSRFDEFEVPELEMSTPMGQTKTSAAHKQLTAGFAAAFPNFKHTLSRCLESGDSISCEGRFAGDHTGPMQMPTGQVVPPTGKHVDFAWGGFATVKGGKVVSLHVYFDPNVMMQQLGLMPSPGKALAGR